MSETRLTALVLLAALAACVPLMGQPSREAKEAPHLVWPPPPDPPRIEFVESFKKPSELGIRSSAWRRLFEIVIGAPEVEMLRPAGVAAAGSELAVADAGSGRVHLYDLLRHRYLSLQACGDHRLHQPVAAAFLRNRLYVSDAAASRILIFELDGRCAGGWPLLLGSRPAGLAVDPLHGYLYMADTGAHQVVVFDTNGSTVEQIGRRGTATGEFNFPGWLALDRSGRLYVSDSLNFRVQLFLPRGEPAGTFGHLGDGSGDFARPKGIGVDRDGHVYVVDALFDAVQVFDSEGQFLMAFGSRGTGPGEFWLPSGLAIDGDRIYVADSYNRRVQVFRYLGGGA